MEFEQQRENYNCDKQENYKKYPGIVIAIGGSNVHSLFIPDI